MLDNYSYDNDDGPEDDDFVHDRWCWEDCEFCSKNSKGREVGRMKSMKTVKTIEIILRAASALIAGAIAVIRCFNYVGKLAPALMALV